MDAWSSNPVLTCQSCGTELPFDAKFCWSCGTPAGSATDSPASSATTADPTLLRELHDVISRVFTDLESHAWSDILPILLRHPHLANVPYEKEQRTALHRLVSGNPQQEVIDGKPTKFIDMRELAVQYLFKTPGLNVNVQDREGRTPLNLALYCLPQLPFGTDDPDADVLDVFRIFQGPIIQELLGLGADPNIPDIDGKTPVHLAAERGRDYTLYHLFRHGGDPDAVDRQGWTPLHYATRYRYPVVIKALQEESDVRAGKPVPLPEPITLPGEE